MRENNRAHHDVLAALSRSRPAALDPDQLAGSARQQADLQAILTSSPEEPVSAPTPARRGRTWRIAIPIAVVAAATAAVVVIATSGTGPAPTTPKSTEANGPTGTTQPTQPVGPVGPVVLLDMATAIAQQPAGEGVYWEQIYENGVTMITAAKPHPFVLIETSETRLSNATRPGLQNEALFRDAMVEPYQPQDWAAWRADGSPTTVPMAPPPGTPAGGPVQTVKIGPGPADSGAPMAADGTVGEFDGQQVTYADLQQLPGDATALANNLDQRYQQDKSSLRKGWPEVQWQWDTLTDLLTLPVTPAVRAAVYRVLAGLPGLVALGHVTDPLGRSGIGFGIPDSFNPGQLEEIVVDPNTDSLLSSQAYIQTPTAQERSVGITTGALQSYDAYRQIGWSNTQVSTGH